VLPTKAIGVGIIFCLLRQQGVLTYKDQMSEIQKVIDRLVAQHGGLRKAGRAIGIKAPYLSRLWRGEQSNPGPSILRKLGLIRTVGYKQK